MNIARITVIFYKSIPSNLSGQPGMLFSHRLSFTDQSAYVARLITRHRTARDKVNEAQEKLSNSKGFAAWVWRTLLTFRENDELSLERDMRTATKLQLRNEHPVSIGLRYSQNNNHEQAIDLPHKAWELSELLDKGKNFSFHIDWVTTGGAGIRGGP